MDNQRYLVKHGLIVEKIAKERKLRHVFLFNDIIVAAKQKIAHRFVIGLFSVPFVLQVNSVFLIKIKRKRPPVVKSLV